MKDLRIIISGGGTGGHIFPAISIANALKNRYPDTKILFVGAEGRMEMSKVPAAGYEIRGLKVAGLNRKQVFKNFSVAWKLLRSFGDAKRIIKEFKPDVVVGVGGYASGPTLKMASSLNIPTVLQEQNSYAGITNKYLAKKATKICVAYEGMEKFFPKEKIVLTGNPVRQDLDSPTLNRIESCEHFGLDPAKKVILVIGGSLGSRTMNMSIINQIDLLKDNDVQILWQCGAYYISEMAVQLNENEDKGRICLYDFINRMDMAYNAADLVVSRAGASSISELSLLGKPSILVPSPNVAEDHQTRNAEALVKKDAAIMIKDANAVANLLKTALSTVQDADKLKELSANILKLAQHDSAGRIVDEIVKLVDKE
jgi:UDP-N-acetylglucosamine--N-acetylmuramyl-(pentapeptide) pyrophosphoryl-undecaprenol N-acetylglucosamine transferase